MKFDYVLAFLRSGCFIFRESEPDCLLRKITGVVCLIYQDEFVGPLDLCEHYRLSSEDILADDWNYRCPGHVWQYAEADPTIRQCRICEKEECRGAWANARAVWLKAREDKWRRTAKALPAAGVTTHPSPATCCEKYPKCDCPEISKVETEECCPRCADKYLYIRLAYEFPRVVYQVACQCGYLGPTGLTPGLAISQWKASICPKARFDQETGEPI